ncbi:unnamed protein product [Porites evermanni]|uniref:Uncharacterized protein n=1 Tax=Porites evermanni TaxID=104178 RepID=A0ABN8MBG9_9CNID|nr:unnamed protein product [Porites evermanni]
MHKKNLNKSTDSIRIVRATQVRLEEIKDKIDQEKHKSMKSNYQEKIRIWNELKLIRRVYEPLYVLKKNQFNTVNNQPTAKLDTAQNERNSVCNSRAYEGSNAFVKQPRLLNRAENQNTSAFSRVQRRQTFVEGTTLLTHRSLYQAKLETSAPMRARSSSWSPSITREPSGAYSATSRREHIAKLRSATEEPHVSDSMSSVTMGYLAFKRVLKNNRQSESMERKVVDSRFRTTSMDEAELSVNSRLLMPESGSDINAVEETNELVPETSWLQENPHLVKKVNKPRSTIGKRSSAPVNKLRIRSSLSWPLAEIIEVPSRAATPATQQPEKKAKLSNRCKSSTTCQVNVTGSSESEEEEIKFGTFGDESFKFKIQSRNNKAARSISASKLFKPSGTGCFSRSFQAVSK